jgi:hypothetical protein
VRGGGEGSRASRRSRGGASDRAEGVRRVFGSRRCQRMVGYDGSLTVRVSATQPRLSFRLSFASCSRQSRGAPGRRNETVESASARRSIARLVRDGHQPLCVQHDARFQVAREQPVRHVLDAIKNGHLERLRRRKVETSVRAPKSLAGTHMAGPWSRSFGDSPRALFLAARRERALEPPTPTVSISRDRRSSGKKRP